MSSFTRKHRQKAGIAWFTYSKKNILAAAGKKWHKVFFYSFLIVVLKTLYFLLGGKNDVKESRQSFALLFPELLENETIVKLKVFFGLRVPLPFKLYKNSSIDVIKGYQFQIPTCETPEVSIIIPTYKNYNYTFNCLLCLANIIKNYQLSCEVIVVNDCSPDGTADLLKQINGVRVVQNETNLGFLRSVNHGASVAKGNYFLLLNNDTQSGENFISPLVSMFKEKNNAGAAGGKLIYPSGLMQEAGAYVLSNGSAQNFGRWDHPDFWMYNFVKPADYCTGALLMISKECWQEAGGFDERYVPIYYEESDLCFQIKHIQKKQIYYTPLSCIVHFEGITSGTDVKKGDKKYQETNRQKFSDKWANQLTGYPSNYIEGTAKFYDSGHRKKVLIIYPHIPEFDKDSGANRMKHILQILCTMADVFLYVDSYYNNYQSSYARELQQWGCRIIYRHDMALPETFIPDELLKQSFEYVWLTGFHLTEKYFEKVKSYHQRIIYDTVDLHYLRFSREEQVSQTTSHRSEEIKTKELDFIKRAVITYVVSEVEEKLLKELQTGNVHILSNIHVPVEYKSLPFDERKDLLFIGGFHHQPNIDAVKWLKQDIMPLVWQKNAAIKVHIVGSNPTDEIKQLQQNNFLIHGFVPDVSHFFTESKLFVCPLRYGAGVKGKIGQALEYHLPVVTTAVGSEGMGMRHGYHCWQADDTQSFADAILHLYETETDWKHIHQYAREALEKFSPATALQELNRLMKM
jgi:O-antigen biosynthesis protein